MTEIEEYLRDPCGTLSIPLWKWKSMRIPENMKIIHHRDYTPEAALGYREERFFRLYHSLKIVQPVAVPGFCIRTAEERDIPAITAIINASYRDISVTKRQMKSLRGTDVFDPELWLMVEDGAGRSVGCAIADLDREVGESILEWVQVIPGYRRKGIGTLLVTELLRRMQGKAGFATVSGKESKAEGLYRRCGFCGEDVWHILKKA